MDGEPHSPMLVLLFITLLTFLLSAFFSASETALFSIPKEERSALAKGDTREKQIAALLEKGEETLIVILMGNVFVNILAISLTGQLLNHFGTLSLVLKIAITTLLLLVLGEIIPKNIAILTPRALARFSAPILLKLHKGVAPAVWVFKKFNRFFIHLNYNYFLQSPDPYITSDEYVVALEDSVKKGEVAPTTRDTLVSYIELCKKPITAIAIHRSRLEDRRDGSSYTLHYSSQGTITGITTSHNNTTTTEEADWFPATQDMGTLHNFFVQEKRNTVLLSDEYGDFYGIATLKDFYAYWQKSVRSPKLYQKNTITLSGSTPLIEVEQWFPSQLLATSVESKTVNGLLTTWLKRIPKEGEKETYKSYIFVFDKCDPNKILQVTVYKELTND